uniref:hypothetical protein n=1 Tax=Aerococcus urinaeequi TaxID=51665 RepID=UPI00352A6E1C
MSASTSNNYDKSSSTSLLTTDVGSNLLNKNNDPIISPMYIPIPYSYIYTRFYSNSEVGDMLPYFINTSNTTSFINTAFSLFTLPSIIAKSVSASGYLISTITMSQYITWKEAYDKGQGMQVIVRNNPNYNGYNARTLAEWIPSTARMQ